MKNVSDWGLGPCGITFNKRGALCYGFDHGFGCGWLPHQIQRFVVVIFNFAFCRLSGHDEALVGIVKEPYCPDCGKLL